MKSALNKKTNLSLIASFLSQLKSYNNLIKSRRALAKLSDEMLEDIGVSRVEAEIEAAKPFWRREKNSLFNQTVSSSKQLKQYRGFTKILSKVN